MKKKYLGIHIIAEFWYCKNNIEDPKLVKKIFLETAKAGNNTALKYSYYKFKPIGLTAILILAESHISMHSWPENNYIAFDIFSCGNNIFPKKSLSVLEKYFQPDKKQIKIIYRGKINDKKN